MLLETLDIRKKDFMIYSQNLFDFTNNFKIIDKSKRTKKPEKISYFEVCEIVKNTIPKNLIIYRLLTNVADLDAYSTKYGYFIKINGKPELIYFDPVFAIKDIRHLRFDFNPENFRFKIQQVGLTSKSLQGVEADYEEVFSFDLKAHEAQNQNDKIFADAIFAFDDTYQAEEGEGEDEGPEQKIHSELAMDMKTDGIAQLKNISEEDRIRDAKLSKARMKDSNASYDVREEKIRMLKSALGISEYGSQTLGDENDSIPQEENLEKQEKSMFDLFKSTAKFSDFEARKNQSFILKLKEEQ